MRVSCKINLFVSLAIVAFPVVTWAGNTTQEALELLRKMYTAPQTINYQGTFVYSHDGTIESMKIYHSVGKDGEKEKLYHLNGSAREVVREKGLVTCILSDNKSVMVNKNQSNQQVLLTLPSNYEALQKNYKFILGEDDRIAGRLTRTVLVRPRDGFRYGYKLWVDSDTGLLLSSALINEKNITVERILFTELKVLDHVPQFLLQPTATGKGFTWHRDMTDEGDKKTETTRWVVNKIPKGFLSTKHHVRHVSANPKSMEHIVLSDGLASVSIYVERLVQENKQFIGSSYMGAVNVYGVVVGDHQVTVVGEVPKATVKMIASSVSRGTLH